MYEYTFGVAVHPRGSVDCVSDEAVPGELVSYDSSNDRALCFRKVVNLVNERDWL